MMGKAIFQFLVMALVFFAAWFALSRVDYVKKFHLTGISHKTEKKIGDFIMKTLERTKKEVKNDSAQVILDKIKTRLCIANAIDENDIHVHLLEEGDVNAFALPGNHLVIYTGLIKHADSVSELCGVMAHEIGHMQLNHVMKRLGGELGITVLASIVTNGNSQVAAEAIKILSSSAFERGQETEADKFAVACLIRAHIDPKGMTDFMMKIAKIQSGIPEEMEWISSHPDSKKRAEAIRALYEHETYYSEPVITEEEWAALKSAAKGE